MSNPVKKIFFAAILTGVVVISCATQNSQAVPVAPKSAAATPPPATSLVVQRVVPPPVASSAAAVATPIPSVISDENWSFTLPDTGWIPMPNAPANITRALANGSKHNIILFIKEAFPGSFLQYALLAVQDLKDVGGHLVSAKNVEINGHHAILLEATSSTSNTRVWNWISFDKGFGYSLSCAGSATDDSQRELCASIANTLKIN